MIRLHHVPQTRSFRTLWLLEEMALEYEIVPYSFFDKSLRSDDYLALSPAGRVPALEIDGLVLFESGAITEYLCESRPGLAPAPGGLERADWLEWLHFAETIGNHLANLTQQHLILREPWMRSPTVMKLETMRLARTLSVVEMVAARHDFLLPSGFSAIDTNVGYGVRIARYFVELGPATAAYFDRIQQRPAFQRALEREGVSDLYKQDFYPLPEG